MSNHSKIAVVGMSGLFPGSSSLHEYWQNIVSQAAAVRNAPEHRWIADQETMVDPIPTPDKAFNSRCCLVDKIDIDMAGLNLPKDVVSDLDPLYHMVFNVGQRALSNLPMNTFNRERTGVILAAIALPTDSSSGLTRNILSTYFEKKLFGSSAIQFPSRNKRMAARVTASPAALLAVALELGGGAYTLDAACASSIYAVKLACDELVTGRADAMLAGGVSRPDCLYTQVGFSQLRALSPSGLCAPFDHKANGLVVGEGAGILVLKRLADAIADNDPIHGIIHGIGLSNDMRGNLLAPESNGQLRAMRAAYAAAGWHPSDIDLIECHGAGTPVGDTTELKSLCNLWGLMGWKPGQCAIGSVKSMIGHLLTAAGAAGIIKTLLALKERMLPPSLNFERPPENSPLPNSPFRVQTEAAPWPERKGQRRRAAVSAFGFGGINGHILLEEWTGNNVPEPTAEPSLSISDSQSVRIREPVSDSAPSSPVAAIVGMAVSFGPSVSLPEFQDIVFNGRSIIDKRPEDRWGGISDLFDRPTNVIPQWGGFMNHLKIGINEFRIPPKEIPDILPQHLLMLQVAADAMQDAGLSEVTERPNMGTVIGMDFDFEATNFHFRWALPRLVRRWQQMHFPDLDEGAVETWIADLLNSVVSPLTASRTLGALGGIIASRIAREFRFGSASFGVSAGAASGNKALEIGIQSLQQLESDTVLIGAVDLNGDLRQILTNTENGSFSRDETVHPFGRDHTGTLPGEGAAAVILKRYEQAIDDGDRIYALVSGIGNASGQLNNTDILNSGLTRALNQALKEAQALPSGIGHIETLAQGVPNRDDYISQALQNLFSNRKSPCTLGSSVANIGHTGAASGLAAIVKTALALYHQVIPPLTGYRPTDNDFNPGQDFRFPILPNYWFNNRQDGPRRAVVGIDSDDGHFSAAIMQEAPENRVRSQPVQALIDEERQQPLGPGPFGLFVVQGKDRKSLLTAVKQLCQYAERRDVQNTSAEKLAKGWCQIHPVDHALPMAAVVLAPNISALKSLGQKARQNIENNISQDFGSGGGVCYRTAPLKGGDMAFVYPGAGNHYAGMGREIALHWPEVLRRLDADSGYLKSQFRPDAYMVRGTRNETHDHHRAISLQQTDSLSPIMVPVAFGCMTTALMQSLEIKPQAIIGYSLGEVTGLIATRAWPDRDKVLSRMLETDLFQSQLSGPSLAARKAWGLNSKDDFTWRACVVNRSAEAVQTAIKDISETRLLIVNTANECVVGGNKNKIDTLIRRLGCQAIDLNGVITVHCDALSPVADEYRALHIFPTAAPPGLRFYSCASGRSYQPTTDKAADSILAQALHGFEFPKTIQQAYADGVRIFLEMGPGASCSRLIQNILCDQPHLSLSLDSTGGGGVKSVLKTVGTLLAERIPIHTEGLFPATNESRHSPAAVRQEKQDIIKVPIGGRFLAPTLPTDTHFVPSINQSSEVLHETKGDLNAPQDLSSRLDQEMASTNTESESIISPEQHRTGLDVGDATKINQPFSPVESGKHSAPSDLIDEFSRTLTATADAHKKFLDFSSEISRSLEEALTYHSRLIESLSQSGPITMQDSADSSVPIQVKNHAEPVAYTRSQCIEFAIGKVTNVLGETFAPADTYKTRVRLPAEPLMLVDRILSVDGVKGSLTSGRLVTEHDVLEGAWYLDGERAPVCIAVEAGQADLFLCSYLGIDLAVEGKRVYRLLDASVVFHRDLPLPGETIRYKIKIDKFIRQGETILFFFNFEGTIDNQPLISMTDGCAGFFTEEEILNSGGIIPTAEDREKLTGHIDPQWTELVPQALESYSDEKLDALRQGNLSTCFGDAFNGINLSPSLRLPGGRMKLIDRIQQIDPKGGRYGLGSIRAEADIHPDDWFLTCHFVDDMTMPGTLMYECCSHTLRVFLLRMGWVTDRKGVRYDTVPGIKSVLRCRGPVTPRTRQVIYEVELKEIGYGPEPYALADAHMYADGRYIVRFTDMAIRMPGLNRESLVNEWKARRQVRDDHQDRPAHKVLFDRQHILSFATGKPSEAFGDRYKPFDTHRFIARLPAPPYSFIDRIVKVEPDPWVLEPGGWVEAEFDVRSDDWYFKANQSDRMPYCVLLEIALQACGWLAAYAGSALRSSKDLRFRNLDGQAILYRDIPSVNQTLKIRCRMTKVSQAGDIIIESFEFQVWGYDQLIYDGNTVFGFFTSDALADQKGVQVADSLRITKGLETEEEVRGIILPDETPLTPSDSIGPSSPFGLTMPSKALQMIDCIETCQPHGGPHGLGYLRATKKIDPEEWFFKAHFFQDPVCPGSLGVESFIQLLKFEAIRRWGKLVHNHRFEHIHTASHTWKYRGQINKQNKTVEVEAFIKDIKFSPEPELHADGLLRVDGLAIYHMENYGLRLVPL